jgi:hypothetical protein
MESKDSLEFGLEDLSLEPMDEPANTQAQPAKAAARFKIDTRGKNERRINSDRRNAIRFEQDRRAGEDRRAGPKPWALGTDI